VCQACSRLEQKHGKKSSSLPRPHALSVNAGKKSRSFLSYLMTTDNWMAISQVPGNITTSNLISSSEVQRQGEEHF